MLWGERLNREAVTLAARRARLQDALSTLSHLLKVTETRVEIDELAGELVGDPVDTDQDVAAITECLDALDHNQKLQEASEALEAAIAVIASQARGGGAAPPVKDLSVAASGKDASSYRSCFEEVAEVHRLRTAWERQRDLLAKLRVTAPLLAERVYEQTVTDEELADLEDAWSWALCKTKLAELGKEQKSELRARLTEIQSQKQSLIRDLAGQLAWDHALSRLSEEQQQHLKAYGEALRRLGKGMGKRAASDRAEARRHLEVAQGAVPAWIMPTHRVAELFELKEGAFDLVIVDEASQSGLEAMFLFWLGKQIVIVGDNEQISPGEAGVTTEQVAALQQQYLQDFELRDLLNPKESLFDQAKVRYSGEIWLTEHFRCMPEIIEFSNRYVYAPLNKRLEPLRQFGQDRLTPLKRVWVTHGEQLSSPSKASNEATRSTTKAPRGSPGINKQEAEEVVRAVIKCHEDPTYKGKSFGVISLLATSKQADWIERRLLERLGQEAWDERQLRCGSPYNFQGDERDIIFLSMVSAVPDGRDRLSALGNTADKQRFNVATSRAKDQMWLFHTPTLEQLNPDCPRHRLISYLTDPPPLEFEPFTDPVNRHIAHPLFRSLFEQRVFLDIRERGYGAIPNLKAYGKEIDIVIVGAKGRLAVECDGTHWHTPETYAADLDRQQQLERHGWEFVRVTDLDYNLDPSEALEELWGVLKQKGIEPLGLDGSPSSVVDYIEASPTAGPVAEPARGGETEANDDEPDQERLIEARAGESSETPELPDTTSPSSETMRIAQTSDTSRERVAASPARTSPQSEVSSGSQALEPYRAWEPPQLRSPLDMTKNELAEVLVSVVEAEGPVVTERAFQLVVRAAGMARLGRQLKTALEKALALTTGRESILISDPLGTNDPLQQTLRLPVQPSVRARQLGDRAEIQHVPPLEIAALLNRPDIRDLGEEARFRAVLGAYGLSRLTSGVKTLFRNCLNVPLE